MAANRTDCFEALYARVETLSGITVLPNFVDLDQVSPGQCPAVCLTKGQETATTVQGFPSAWRLEAFLVLYVHNGGGRKVPTWSVLNPLLDQIDKMFLLQPTETPAPNARFVPNPLGTYYTTLGGLCVRCSIAGPVQTVEGLADVDDMALAEIPVEIITTG